MAIQPFENGEHREPTE
jgi:hypothetical protein